MAENLVGMYLRQHRCSMNPSRQFFKAFAPLLFLKNKIQSPWFPKRDAFPLFEVAFCLHGLFSNHSQIGTNWAEWLMTSLEIWELLICACLSELRQNLKVKLLKGATARHSSMSLKNHFFSFWSLYYRMVLFILSLGWLFSLISPPYVLYIWFATTGVFPPSLPYKTAHKRILYYPKSQG